MNKNNFFLLPLVFSFIAFSVALYVCTEDNIYYWDYTGYYNLFINFGKLCQKKFSEFAHYVIISIQNDDYNVSSVLLPISFYSFFGGSRISFIFSLFFFYLMPLSYMIYYLTSKLSSNADAFTSIFFTLFYSPFLYMLFVGYTDLSCIALLCAASYIVVKNKNENIQVRWMLFVGFLLLLCFMFRRGYSYCLISFYAALLYNVIFYRYKFKKFVFGFAAASLTTLVCIITFQFPLVVRIMQTNYTYQYSAWSQGSWLKNIFSAYDNLPPSLWVIFIFSIFFLLYKKQKEVVFLFCL